VRAGSGGFHDLAVAPRRPGVGPLVDLRLVAPPLQRFVEIAGEIAGVARASAPQGLNVVQRVVGVLRSGKGLQLRDPDVHLLRRLGVRRVEEFECQAGDVSRRAGLRDPVGR
jgi:hypothetical protein